METASPSDPPAGPPDEYLAGLIAAYEAEVSGEAYFRALLPHFPAQAALLARCAALECETAARMRTLLQAHGLASRGTAELQASGQADAALDASKPWRELLAESIEQGPRYVAHFEALAAQAPAADAGGLAALVDHERQLISELREALGRAARAPR